MSDDDGLAALAIAFTETPEFEELADALDQFHDDTDDTPECIEVRVPKRYLTLLHFLELKAATAENRAPRPPEQVLSAALVRQLEADRMELSVTRTSHPYFLAAWNRLCDERGVPEAKLPKPEANTREAIRQ